jgi:hypothetical protein
MANKLVTFCWCWSASRSEIFGPLSRSISSVSVEFHIEFHVIKYAHVAKRECNSFMGCEKSFSSMECHWHSYLVFSLDNLRSIERRLFIKNNYTNGQEIATRIQ